MRWNGSISYFPGDSATDAWADSDYGSYRVECEIYLNPSCTPVYVLSFRSWPALYASPGDDVGPWEEIFQSENQQDCFTYAAES